jgi:uncharacterized caspase-like protein
MNIRGISRTLCPGLAVLGAVCIAGTARADQALVVGVNQYSKISGADLGGCVNDAKSMAGSLRKYGFDVTLLTDGQATKQGIASAIQSIKGKLGPNEKFVLFFAGHGANDSGKNPVILPSDALSDSEANDISRDSLFDMVRSVPTEARTVLLDSCFSGAMMRAHRDVGANGGHRKIRFLVRPKLRGPVHKELGVVNDSDTPIQGGADGSNGVCYFAAARDSEYSQEDDISGERHGFFTYYLSQRLSGARDPWGAVQTDVTGQVSSATKDTQHPVLSAKFVDKGIFESINGMTPPHKVDPDHTVWDDFSTDRVDRDKLSIRFMPRDGEPVTPVAIGQRFKTEINCGIDGYLVLLALDQQGNLQLPQGLAGQDPIVKVSAGYRAVLPSASQSFIAKQQGMQSVKAILFASRERAEALVNAFTGGSLSETKARKTRELGVENDTFDWITATISFEVVDADSRKRP